MHVVRLLLAALSIGTVAPMATATAQDTPSTRTNDRGSSHLGLTSIGAATASAGWASVEGGFHAWQVAGAVDFGYIATRRLRLVADAAYLRSLPKSEYVASEGRTYRDIFRDLSANLSLVLHAAPTRARVSPFVATGVGVHVLSSSFGSTAIDTRYNTNNFGIRAAVGARIRLGDTARRALQVEFETQQARDVRRIAATVGISGLFNDLARR